MSIFRRSWVFAVLLLACQASGQQSNSLNLVLSVQEEGGVLATEQLALAMPPHEPVHWRMATAVTGPLGVRRLLFVDVLEVSDARGNLLAHRIRRYGDAVEVIVPEQSLAGNTVSITYSVRNAVRFRDASDELLWPLGQHWSAPLHGVSVNTFLPATSAGQCNAQLVRGDGGPRIAMPLPLSGTRAAWEIIPSNPSQAFIEIVFAPGALQQPSMVRRATWFVQANPVVLFPVLLLIVVLLFRRISAHRASGPVVPRYDPPADLPPAEAGVLVDGTLDPRDLAAMLLDLARRGFIRIEPGSPDEGVPYSAPDFVLRLMKPMDNWKGAYAYEHVVLFHTFYGGQWTKLSSVSLRFYAVVPQVARMIREELQRKGLYVPPWRVAAQRAVAIALVAAAFAIAQFAGWFAVVQTGTVALVAVLSLAVVLPFLMRGISHRTARGDAIFDELRGFEEFMNTVEADRMERVTPDLFESLLPYAIVLSVEHHWGATFSTISTGPPLWWDTKNAGGIPDFVRMVSGYSLPTRRAPALHPEVATAAKA